MEILFFGIAKDIAGMKNISLSDAEIATVGDLKTYLHERFPSLRNLKSLAIAVNESYANDNQRLVNTDVVALIPPVSGG